MTQPFESHSAEISPAPGNTLITNFDQLNESMLVAEADKMIADAEEYLSRIASEQTAGDTPDQPNQPLDPLTGLSSVYNTLALELGGEVGIVHGLINGVHPDRNIRDAAGREQGRIQKFADGVFSDPQYEGVYQALQAIDPTTLDEQDKQRYDYYQSRFASARREASGEAAAQMGALRESLAEAEKNFRKNNKKTPDLQLTQEEFEGLPAGTRAQLEATKRKEGGYTLQLGQSKLDYLLEHADQRDLRQRAYDAYHDVDNDQLVQQMAELRHQIARAGGHRSWTEIQVQGLTLDTPEKVTGFCASIKDEITEAYQTAVAKLQALLEEDGITGQIQEYDLKYYERKLIEKSYDLGSITFSYQKTIRGLCDFFEELLGVKIEEAPEVPVWAAGVQAYKVRDADTEDTGTKGKQLSTLYVDPFERTDKDKAGGKRKSAATYALQYGLTDAVTGEETQLPISAVVASLTPPRADGQEATMTLLQVESVAHELGHALHGAVARTRGPEYGGEKLPFDSIEIVSLAFGRLAKDPNLLLRFANDGIPEAVKNDFIRNQDTVQRDVSALSDMRWFRATMFDLAIHGEAPNIPAAREQARELTAPVGTDNAWIGRQTHWANEYTGRYHTYVHSNTKAKGVAAWLRQQNYSPSAGRELRKALERGGQPGADAKFLSLAGRVRTTQGAGKLALGQ